MSLVVEEPQCHSGPLVPRPQRRCWTLCRKSEKLKAAADVTKEMNKEAEDILIQPIGERQELGFPPSRPDFRLSTKASSRAEVCLGDVL